MHIDFKESQIVNYTDVHEDLRGGIYSVVNEDCKNVSIIESKSGSIRSNHYHKKDWHYMLVLEGVLEYFFYSNSERKVKFITVKQDQIIFTPNLEIHATFFPQYCKLLVVSGYLRDSATYEADTVRVEFINHYNLLNAKKENFVWSPKVDL
jgi:oxalate decarboxylase/phosphoglucose isomerase-like protein (cupin superfamily)